jgi:hypothetical protein
VVAEDEMLTLYAICKQRFETLQRIVHAAEAREGEDEIATKGRMTEVRGERASRNRRTTRKSTVSDVTLQSVWSTHSS